VEITPIVVGFAHATTKATNRITEIEGVEVVVYQTIATLIEQEEESAERSIRLYADLAKEWIKPAIYFAHKVPDSVSIDEEALLAATTPMVTDHGEFLLKRQDYSLIRGDRVVALYKDHLYTFNGHTLNPGSHGTILSLDLRDASEEDSVDEPPEKRKRIEAAMAAIPPLLLCQHCGAWPSRYASLDTKLLLCSMDCAKLAGVMGVM
jgi:hypothetical protein